MTSISRSVLVPYTAEEMYALVSDIERYPDFLPWCKSATILEQQGEALRARIELSKGGVHKSFTTRNRLQRNKMIEMRLDEGPFKHLEGFWRFDGFESAGSRVALDMEFEFAGKIVSMAFGPVFNQIASSLVEAFHKRAVEMYGKR